MWDSFNGTLMSPSMGNASPYITFQPNATGFVNSAIPPVPYGYGNSMFPGGMGFGGMGCLPMDTFNSSAPVPPLKHAAEHSSGAVGEFLGTAVKVLGAVAIAGLGYKLLKGKRPKAK